MQQVQHGFTILEVVLVIAVSILLGIVIGLSGVLSFPKTNVHNEQQQNAIGGNQTEAQQQPQQLEKQQLIQCTNNLRQIGIGLLQYEMTYNSAPVYSNTSATTIIDGKLCAANLMRLNASAIVDDLKTFCCPFGTFIPTTENAKASINIVSNEPNGSKFTSYNLTTCSSIGDPQNKIVVADMPFAKDNVTASTHDTEATKIDRGPNCLFKDGHVINVKKLCPEGSSECELSPAGNIYRVDGGAGKGKDTCILGVAR